MTRLPSTTGRPSILGDLPEGAFATISGLHTRGFGRPCIMWFYRDHFVNPFSPKPLFFFLPSLGFCLSRSYRTTYVLDSVFIYLPSQSFEYLLFSLLHSTIQSDVFAAPPYSSQFKIPTNSRAVTEIKIMHYMYGIRSVSYTHLDVYKRQGYHIKHEY